MKIVNGFKSLTTLIFFYKQPADKQLALGWQVAKQLSGLNPFIKQQQKQLLSQQYTKVHLPQKHYWENFKIIDHKYRF